MALWLTQGYPRVLAAQKDKKERAEFRKKRLQERQKAFQVDPAVVGRARGCREFCSGAGGHARF